MTAAEHLNVASIGPTIEFDNVSLTLGRTAILDNVSFQVQPGSIHALVGPNGGGKSSLIKTLLGQTPHQGRLSLEWPTTPGTIGYVPQALEFDRGLPMTVDDFMAAMCQRRPAFLGLSRHYAAAIGDALERVGMQDKRKRRMGALSGGERQRVLLAQGLIPAPKLLLLDEPLAALDQKRKNEILPYLQRLQTQLDIPILYVSHSLDEVVRLADHLVLLDQGAVLASGPVGEVMARMDLPMAQAEDAGVVVEGCVAGHNSAYQLLSLSFPGSTLSVQVAHAAVSIDTPMRFRILARDISLNLERPAHSSILNLLPVTVSGETPADNAAHVLVRLDMHGTPLLARITRYSRDQLGLHVGQQLWAQVKSVALLA